MVRLTRNRDPEIEILRGLSFSVAAAAAGGAGGEAAGNAGAGVAGEAGLRVRVPVLGAARVGGGGSLGRVVEVKLVEDVEEPVGFVSWWAAAVLCAAVPDAVLGGGIGGGNVVDGRNDREPLEDSLLDLGRIEREGLGRRRVAAFMLEGHSLLDSVEELLLVVEVAVVLRGAAGVAGVVHEGGDVVGIPWVVRVVQLGVVKCGLHIFRRSANGRALGIEDAAFCSVVVDGGKVGHPGPRDAGDAELALAARDVQGGAVAVEPWVLVVVVEEPDVVRLAEPEGLVCPPACL